MQPDYIFRGIASAIEAGAISGKCRFTGTIYRELVKMRRPRSGKVCVYPRRLAARVGCSERTAYRAIIELRDLGLIMERRRSWRGTWITLNMSLLHAIASAADAAAEQVRRRPKSVPWYRAIAASDAHIRRVVKSWLGQSCHDDSAMTTDKVFKKDDDENMPEKGSLADRARRLGLKIST